MRASATSTLLLAALAQLAAAGPVPRGMDALAAGAAALDAKAPEEAVLLLESALADPDLAPRDLAWLLLSRAHLEAGRPHDSLRAAHEATGSVEGSLRGGEARRRIALALEATGDSAAAGRAWREARRNADAQDTTEALAHEAAAHEAAGDWSRAAEAWRTLALEHAARGPADALARARAAGVRASRPVAVTPVQLLDRARQLFEGNVHARAMEALREVEAAAGPGSTAREALALRARAHLALRENEAADDACKVVLSSGPDAEQRDSCRHVMARSAWRRGDADTTLALTEAAARDPRSASPKWRDDLLLMRAGVYQEREQWDRVVETSDALVAAGPKAPLADDARWKAAWARLLQGKLDDAEARFARLAQSDSSLAPGAAYWAGESADRAGRRDAALAAWRALVLRDPLGHHGGLALEALRSRVPPSDVRDLLAETEARAFVLEPPDPPALDSAWGRRYAALRDACLHRPALVELEEHRRRVRDTDGLLLELAVARSRAGQAASASALVASRFGRALAKPSRRSVRELWEVQYPRPHAELVDAAAARHGVDPSLVAALIRTESWWDPAARSGADARGLMQLLPSTARRLAKDEGVAIDDGALFDAAVNVRLGTRHVAELLEKFGGDADAAAAAYNAGEERAAEWWQDFAARGVTSTAERIERIPYRETRAYVKKVREAAAWYAWLAAADPVGTSPPLSAAGFVPAP